MRLKRNDAIGISGIPLIVNHFVLTWMSALLSDSLKVTPAKELKAEASVSATSLGYLVL